MLYLRVKLHHISDKAYINTNIQVDTDIKTVWRQSLRFPDNLYMTFNRAFWLARSGIFALF